MPRKVVPSPHERGGAGWWWYSLSIEPTAGVRTIECGSDSRSENASDSAEFGEARPVGPEIAARDLK